MKDEKGLTLPNLKEITENTLKEFMEKYAQEKMIDRYCDDVIELAKQEEEFAIKFRDYMKHHDEEEIQAHKEFDEDDLEFFGRCWKNEIELFSQDIDLTIRFLDHECTAEEFVFIKDIFNEVVENTYSSAFIDCLYRLAKKYPQETQAYDIEKNIEYAKNYCEILNMPLSEAIKKVLEENNES